MESIPISKEYTPRQTLRLQRKNRVNEPSPWEIRIELFASWATLRTKGFLAKYFVVSKCNFDITK